MEANVRLEHELLAVEHEHTVHCMLELDAPPAPDGARPPLHVALALDRSGSMHGPKLEVAKQCAAYLASRLLPSDRFSLVAFDHEVELVASLGPVDHAALRTRIDGIHERGSTNLSGGWLKAIEELGRGGGDATNRVLLLTDGIANVGITEPRRLLEIAQAARRHTPTTTIGFGADFDEDLLRAIADGSGANTWFAATPDDAPGIFESEFDGLASLVAQNVSVEIVPGDDAALVAVLHDYPTVAAPGGLQVQLGDLYGSERRRIVFELHVPGRAALGPARVAEVVVRSVTLGAETALRTLRVPVTVNLVSPDEAAAAGVDHAVTEEVQIVQAAKARRRAMEGIDRGDHEASARVLRDTARTLRHLAGAERAERVDEMLTEAASLEEHADVLQGGAFGASLTRKAMAQEEWLLTRGRKRPRRPRP